MALLSRLLVVLVAALSLASALPEAEDKIRPKCRNKLQRKAWHTLSKKEKKAYIDAELCLMKKPAKLGLPGATVRFEELQANHQIQSAITHNVGAFLPFHRLLMHAHEKLLREECGYTGAQPYWYEQRDAGKFYKADIFDPVTGFGGFGKGSNKCITDGPFAWFVNHMGPGYRIGPQCIYRSLNDTLSQMAAQKYIDACYKRTKFVDAWVCIELGPHISGHGGVGGKMQDPIASPGDPLFYLHHTWLDKVFWDWQALDLPKRLYEIGGQNAVTGPPPLDFPPPSPPPCTGLPCIGDPPIFLPSDASLPPFDALIPPANAPGPAGDPGNVTTLNHILNMYGVIPNRTIGEVMDIGNALLCYEYV